MLFWLIKAIINIDYYFTLATKLYTVQSTIAGYVRPKLLTYRPQHVVPVWNKTRYHLETLLKDNTYHK